jgi:hypothetical protein
MFTNVVPGSLNTNAKFHKLGTVMDKKTRKISVVQNIRRNTQFKQGDTQAVIDNISPFVVKSRFQRPHRDSAKSPQPQLAGRFQAFSP